MARGKNDSPIQLSDTVTISGTIVSTSGPIGSQGTAVILPKSQFPAPTFSALGSDSYGASGVGNLISIDGQVYGGVAGGETSTPGTVTAISGTGSIAVLTVQLNSGLVVQVPANACATSNAGGIALGSI
jgi:hypothetical protein